MSFETQVEGLTSISIDSSGTAPTQSELSQFLSDGAIEVINAMPREKKILCATEDTFTSTAFGSEGVSQILTSSEVLSVTRAGEPCRQIPAELAGRASDSSDFASAHMEKATDTDPVWYIYNGRINALPDSGDCKFLEINRPDVNYNHTNMSTALSSFPLDCEYLVVLYASIKSLQNAMGNKTSTLPADMTLPTIPASPVSPSFDSGEISISASVPTYTQPVFNPPTLGTVGDLTLPTPPVSPSLTTQSVTLTGDAPVYIAPDYSKVTSFIETDEDVELASVKIQQVSNEARDSLNRFNDGNVEYQANLQKDIQNAWKETPDRKSWSGHQIRSMLISKANVKIQSNLEYIRVAIVLAPLLGLLGTILGMIEVFHILAVTGGGDAKAMAGGVAKSTIPAMAGLMAAIPATFASRILEQKAKKQSDLLQEHLTFE